MYTRNEVTNGKDVERKRRGRVGVEQKCVVNDDHGIRVKQLECQEVESACAT